MEKNVISASSSVQNLTYRPGDPAVAFEVTVNNDSDRFANFQIEIMAAGENRNPAYRWYRLEPEVAAAKPPGSSTVFQVFILNTPIPGFVGTVNLIINIFSPQLAQQCRLVLRLRIERDNSPTHLSVELPVREFQVYPRNSVDIPVRVRNLGQQPAEVMLRFTGVEQSWLLGSAERRLAVDPGGLSEVTFQCQPPSVVQAPSQNYLFTIEAASHNSYPAKAEGSIEVLPVGFVEFNTTQKQQKIPNKNIWLPDWKSNTGSFELIFKNASNLQQQIDVQVQGRDWRKCSFNKSPEIANLNLGETTKVILDAKTKRPWIGIGKTLQFEAKSELSDQRLGSTDPATQSLELQVLPIIPLWLQLAAIAALALLLAWILLRSEPIMHTRSVNSVGFNGTGLSVVSGSDDCTLRLWSTGGHKLEPERIKLSESSACDKQQNPKGLLAITNDIVRVVRFMPLQNNRVAVGLDNGVIELRDVPSGTKIDGLRDRQDPKAQGDRVFDLAFTPNSLYLFSSYGSGKVRVWSRQSPNKDFLTDPQQVLDIQRELKVSGFEARALALSPDTKTLVVSGNYKRFILLDWNPTQLNNQFQSLSEQKLENLDEKVGRQDYVWGLAFVPNSPDKILATSDSAGFITIWNLNQCQINKNPNPQEKINELNCSPIDRWSASKTSVRALAFSQDGKLIVSGGDDGRVVVWYLTSEHKLDRAKAIKGKTIYENPKKINSIDLKEINPETLVVSGSEDSQVTLHSIK